MNGRRIRMRLFIILLPVSVLVLLLSLQAIPRFNLQAVQVSVDGGSRTVPVEVKEYLASLVGTSLFALNLSREEGVLLDMGIVESAKLRRRLPSTLDAKLTLIDTPSVIVTETQAYVVRDTALVLLRPEDVSAWQAVAITIEVPSSYAQLLSTYGLDSAFHQVMELARSLGGKTTLITRIKYDNNSSNSFGKMVLELSSLDAQIWVREPVEVAHVQAAVALVEEDQQDSLSFLSSGMKRYDLYREGLVRRQ